MRKTKVLSPAADMSIGAAMKTRQLLASTILLFVAGCMLGPDYRRPALQIPSKYRAPTDNREALSKASSFADLPWWQVFSDPQLQQLIRTASERNYDMQLATERINAARAQVVITRSSLFPQLQGSGDLTRGKDASSQTKFRYLSLAADVAFQLDLFGRLRRATEASRAQLLATEEAQRVVMLTLVSDVASDYFTLLQLDLQLQIARDTVKTQEDSVKLTSFRLEHGVATKLDVLQAQQVLDTANAQIPDLERQIGQEEDAISILLGNYPQDVARGLTLVQQPLPPSVPPGLPSSLLERRPDIRQAEQQLIAANAEIGVAKAEFFPQVSLTGSSGGVRGTSFASPTTSRTGIWSYGVQVTQPIFTGGALTGNLHLAESQSEQALIAYKQAIQHAFGDVSDALIAYQRFNEVRVRQEQLVADLAETVRLSTMRYQGGTTTYLEVLDGQRSLFSAELTLAQARGNEYQSLVQLYKALGGGWQ
jgi:outer membrane protein, multidrug efflux system